jgi:peptidoglycan-associated lipoprotein
MTILKWCYPIVVLVLAGVACHTRQPATSPSRTSVVAPTVPLRALSPPAAAVDPAAAGRPAAASLSEAELFGRKSLDELNAEHPLADAFFDYDQNTLRDDARQALQKDVAWLSKWAETAISLEGYCDERGTAEYNLALGERRAQVVKEYLENLGVSPSRIRTVSLGKESPFCQDANENCWSKNRRGHFVITAK